MKNIDENKVYRKKGMILIAIGIFLTFIGVLLLPFKSEFVPVIVTGIVAIILGVIVWIISR